MSHVNATGSEIRHFYSTPPFLLYARTSKKRSDSLRLARLAVNLVTFVRKGSGHEMKPKTGMLHHFRMWKMPTFSFCP